MWSHLRLTVIHAEYQAEHECRLPPNKGSTFRGAFGHALKEQACFQPPSSCRACQYPDRCAYGAIYETRECAEDHAAPRPYLFTPDPDPREVFRPGDRFKVVLTLIGSARVWLPWVTEALIQTGARGLGWGRKPWTLSRVAAETAPGTLQDIPTQGRINGLRVGEIDGASLVAAKPFQDSVLLRFVTPVDLRVKGEPVPPLQGAVVMSRLLRRVGSLMEHYCGWVKEEFDFGSLVSDATLIDCPGQRLRIARWDRYSTNTESRHPLSGHVGEVEWASIPPSVWPYLVIGERLHVGKGASFGMGKYELDVTAPLGTCRQPHPPGATLKERIAARPDRVGRP